MFQVSPHTYIGRQWALCVGELVGLGLILLSFPKGIIPAMADPPETGNSGNLDSPKPRLWMGTEIRCVFAEVNHITSS